MTTPTHEKIFPEDEKLKLPLPFIFRRLHSLLGIFLVIYLFEHLLVNSQASMFFKDDGYTFVRMVNRIHAIPYLRVVEILFLGLPFLLHGLWGMHYAATSNNNSVGRGGKAPHLPQYKRNRAFTWQRLTSWILLVGIVLHVIQMRFLDYPEVRVEGDHKIYTVQVENDPKLATIAKNFDAKILKSGEKEPLINYLTGSSADLSARTSRSSSLTHKGLESDSALSSGKNLDEISGKVVNQSLQKVTIEAPSAGVAFFLIVRNTFKSPLMVLLYSIFVVSAAYHAFNGLWTAFITWGLTCTRRSQKRMRILTTLLMWLVMLFGLMACWGPYWTYVWS